jgi:very-short-patch-repair endonuclease
MRHVPAPTETVMWRLLRNRRLCGFKFRRQHPIGPYIADFFCAAALLVIELDGDSHVGQTSRDEARDAYFESLGLVILRFWNTQVFDDEEAVLETIHRTCSERIAALPEHVRHLGAKHWTGNNNQNK